MCINNISKFEDGVKFVVVNTYNWYVCVCGGCVKECGVMCCFHLSHRRALHYISFLGLISRTHAVS